MLQDKNASQLLDKLSLSVDLSYFGNTVDSLKARVSDLLLEELSDESLNTSLKIPKKDPINEISRQWHSRVRTMIIELLSTFTLRNLSANSIAVTATLVDPILRQSMLCKDSTVKKTSCNQKKALKRMATNPIPSKLERTSKRRAEKIYNEPSNY